jgi:hypothetical protein
VRARYWISEVDSLDRTSSDGDRLLKDMIRRCSDGLCASCLEISVIALEYWGWWPFSNGPIKVPAVAWTVRPKAVKSRPKALPTIPESAESAVPGRLSEEVEGRSWEAITWRRDDEIGGTEGDGSCSLYFGGAEASLRRRRGAAMEGKGTAMVMQNSMFEGDRYSRLFTRQKRGMLRCGKGGFSVSCAKSNAQPFWDFRVLHCGELK